MSDQTDTKKPVVFRPPGVRDYVEAELPMHSLNDDMMDIAFTKAVGCTQYPGGCDGMRKDHRFADPVPLGEAWRHKYLIDIDGMGYSARLFSLLKSQSAVLKTTVYREFFSDWIQPWSVPSLVCRPLHRSARTALMSGPPSRRLQPCQGALHPNFDLVQGALQCSRLLLRPDACHVGRRECQPAGRPLRRQGAPQDCGRGPQVVDDDRPQGRHGNLVRSRMLTPSLRVSIG